jgi:RpiB/LacA/LacB family sugar-phosphate isomerase
MAQSSDIIVVGSDHAGYAMKEYIKTELTRLNIAFEDVGVYNEDRSDYPLYAAKVASRVANGEVTRGIVVCGSGIGASITANRFRKVRAALCITEEMALLSRKHNDANVLVLGGRITPYAEATKILTAWLNTAFEGGRHATRIAMIDEVSGQK